MASDHIAERINRRYILHEIIGSGGMGVVYRATDRLTHNQVALKRLLNSPNLLIFDHELSSASFRLSLAHEFKLAASLKHPFIIQVLDYGFDAQQLPFFTMELLERPLTILEVGRRLPLIDRIRLLNQVLHALAYLHRRGIVHRDLKPGNVVVSDGAVKLLDFGLSTSQFPDSQLSELGASTTAGTLAYMAPEILLGENVGIPSDLYSVGILAYELIAGQHPYNIHDPATLVTQVVGVMPEFENLPGPKALRRILEKLLQKSPIDRFHSAEAVIAALGDAFGDTVTVQLPTLRESFLQAARMVGRDREIDVLNDALADLLQFVGSAWLIAGESGVGKTRLLDEIRTLAMVRGAGVIRSQSQGGRPFELWMPFFSWLLLFDEYLSSDQQGLLHHLLGHTTEYHLDTPSEVNQLRQHLIHLIEHVLEYYQSPLVILLDDLQWAGSESLSLLADMLLLLNKWPLLIVGSYRDEEMPALANQLPQMNLVKLRRLSEEAVRDLSLAMIGNAGANPQVIELIQRETEGNVLFIVEVVRTLAEEYSGLDQIGLATLPQTVFAGGVDATIRRRLDRLDTRDRDLLQKAAVSGHEIDLSILKRLEPRQNIEHWLASCADAAVLEFVDGRWQFVHNRMRTVLVAELGDARLRELHRRVAQIYEQRYAHAPGYYSILAYHWRLAEDTEREIHYSILTGEQSVRRGAFHEGIGYLKRALSLLENRDISLRDVQHHQVVINDAIAEAHLGLGDYKAARHLYRANLILCEQMDDIRGTAMCFSRLGDIAQVLGELDKARKLFERSLAMFEDAQDQPGIVRLLNRLGDIADEVGDTETAKQFYQRSLTVAREIGTDWGKAGASVTQSIPDTDPSDRSVYEASLKQLEQLLEMQRANRNERASADTLYRIADVLVFLERYDEAHDCWQRCATMRRRLRDAIGVIEALERLGALSLLRGDMRSARNALFTALQMSTTLSDYRPAYLVLLRIAQFFHLQGKSSRALQILSFLLNQTAVADAILDEAEELSFQLEKTMAEPASTQAWEHGKSRTLEDVIADVLPR